MTDNGIKREKTFSEELPYFKEQMKEVFDYYDNPKGCSEMLYISVLNDSNRIVRKAEEEITRQQAENKRLEKEVNLVSIQFQDLQERYEEAQAEIERLKSCVKSEDEVREIAKRTMEPLVKEITREQIDIAVKLSKAAAVKECLAKVKNYIKTHCNPYGKPDFDYDTSIRILNFIDNIVKEMVGDDK